ncbi:MAG: DUF5685 family protein [Alphaproteobacteria bacterium]|nr:DUF5685 family protein [Alphaproteobacteria bacterium]
MFGLMHFQWTPHVYQNYAEYRLHYCGVCKSIGTLYNQECRWLLNRDIVFLVDLIQKIDANNTLKQNESFLSQNCFVLPPSKQIPKIFQFIAAMNLVLGYYKLLDNIHDEKGMRALGSKVLLKRLKPQFVEAEHNLVSLNFNLDFLKQALENQYLIEQKLLFNLEDYAANIGSITGFVAAHCFKLIDKPELSNLGKTLGNLFGNLVYIIDAVNDLESDFKKRRFNAILSSLQLKTPHLTPHQKHKLATFIINTLFHIKEIIATLLKNQSHQTELVYRLEENVSKTLSKLGVTKNHNPEMLVLLKRFYFKLITRLSFLIGIIGYAILPKKNFYQSTFMTRVFKTVSKDRTKYFYKSPI